MLERGQGSGTLRPDFDPEVMTTALIDSVDARYLAQGSVPET